MRYNLEYLQCSRGGIGTYNNDTPISQIYVLGTIKCWCHVIAIQNLINHMFWAMFSRKGSWDMDSYTDDL